MPPLFAILAAMRFPEFIGRYKLPDILPPVFLMTGEESYLRDQAVARLKKLHPDFESQFLRVSASEFTPDALTDELYTPAFMGQKKLLMVVDDKHVFPTFKERIGQFMKEPSGCASLVWAAPNGKGWELWKKKAVWIECDGLTDEELVVWIAAQVHQRSKKIDRDTAQRLAQGNSDSLAAMANHIEKLCLYVGKRAAVTSQDVEALVSGTADADVRELVSAIEQKSIRGAMTSLERLLGRGENAQMLLGYLAWYYRRALQGARPAGGEARQGWPEGGPGKLAPAGNKGYVRSVPGGSGASRWSALREKHGRILQADLALKTLQVPESMVLEALICDLAK